MRLDCTTEFCDLSMDIATLKHLAFAAECLGQSLLKPTTIDAGTAEANSKGFRAILLTIPQFDLIQFLLTHITETARRADDRLEALEEAANRYVEKPHREAGQ